MCCKSFHVVLLSQLNLHSAGFSTQFQVRYTQSRDETRDNSKSWQDKLELTSLTEQKKLWEWDIKKKSETKNELLKLFNC